MNVPVRFNLPSAPRNTPVPPRTTEVEITFEPSLTEVSLKRVSLVRQQCRLGRSSSVTTFRKRLRAKDMRHRSPNERPFPRALRFEFRAVGSSEWIALNDLRVDDTVDQHNLGGES
jgi:hypothetical protein